MTQRTLQGTGTDSQGVEGIEGRIGYSFRRPELLAAALTHRSVLSERPGEGLEDNERLEFLGDAVLGLAAARWLSERRPGAREGELSRLRSSLVGERALAEAARALGLGCDLRLGRGEEGTGGRGKPSILAGALEALLGAVFLDGGWRCAYRLARTFLVATAGESLAAAGRPDAKTRLQETCQQRWRKAPTYGIVASTGPAHLPCFVAEARLGDEALGRGEGGTRKEAEQAAASAALAAFEPPAGEGRR